MKNIILIGMPSSGKTTIGKLLSKNLGMEFIDTDLVIHEKVKKPLRDIVNEEGLQKFHEIQQNTILEMDADNSIIATGGSVVYGDKSMKHLKEKGVVVFLRLECHEVEKRITTERRFARGDGQSFKSMFDERMPLYEKYADIILNCSNKSEEEISSEIEDKIKEIIEGGA